MQFLQTLFAWAACGTLAALLLLCLAGRLKAHPPSPRAMRGVPPAALVALLALAAAVGSRAVPKSRAPARGGTRSVASAMPDAGSAATPRVTAIDVGPAGVDLVLFRPEADSASAANVTVAACADLSACGNWLALAGAVFPAGETNVLVSIARAALDAVGIATPAFFSFGGSGDTDGDGLADWHESLNAGTDPAAADTDGDLLPDGWELSHGLVPHSADGADGASGDPDGDGLSNWMEHVSGASPLEANSFSPGLGDLAWVLNGFGMPPAYGVEVSFSVGDPSPSHSERWLMRLRDMDEGGRRYIVACDGHGDVAEWTLRLERGRSYVGNIEHVSSSRDVPDFDWCAQVEGLPLTDVLSAGMVHSGAARWIVDYDKSLYIDNEHGLLGVCDPEFGDVDATAGKTFTLHVVKTAVEPAAACSPAEWTGHREFALTGDSTQWADWTIEPSLPNGAKLYPVAMGGEGADVVYGTSRVHVSSGSVATNYTVTARHPICAGSAASAEFTVFRIGVEAMRFNHDLASSAGDAVSIRANYDEVGFDPATGEWSRGGVTNFPACYRAGTMPTVQAKFTVEPKLTTNVTVFAQTTGDLFGLPGLLDATVALTNGASGWVTLPAVGRVFGQVARCAAGFDWHVCGLGPERLAPAKHAGTGPHRVYVVLGDPVEPWSGDLTSDQCAWTNALEWACGAAAGATTLSEAASLVTEGINMSGSFYYDTKNGACHFIEEKKKWLFFCSYKVLLSECLLALNSASAHEAVNCTDCAVFVVSFSNLLGCELYSSRMGWGFATNPYCAIGQPAWTTPSWGWGFSYHEVAWDGDAGDGDLVFDACLRYDGDEDPTAEPHVSQLPVAVQFSDGNPAPPLVYRERLTPNTSYGYPHCNSQQNTKVRRSFK